MPQNHESKLTNQVYLTFLTLWEQFLLKPVKNTGCFQVEAAPDGPKDIF